jgi:3-methyladenine DNA glycosylase Tag
MVVVWVRKLQKGKDMERLMLPEAGIIRHRGKINSAIKNAQQVS